MQDLRSSRFSGFRQKIFWNLFLSTVFVLILTMIGLLAAFNSWSKHEYEREYQLISRIVGSYIQEVERITERAMWNAVQLVQAEDRNKILSTAKLKELAKKAGMEEYFMGVGRDRGSYIGHSIGLEMDEWPVIGLGAHDPLPPGAIITIEPKFMVPGRGAVMVEDDILVTEGGQEILSNVDRELYYF